MSFFDGEGSRDLTEGGIVTPLVALSLPIVATNMLHTAYNLADTFWLGQYSTEALAAISFAFPIVFLLIALGMGLAIAGSVLVAQHTGADETGRAQYAASQTVTFALLGSALLGAVSYPFVGSILSFLGASPAVLPGATAYMQVISMGLPFMFGFFVFNALMRGAGDTVTPMLVMFGTVVVNVVIDPFLINGWTVVQGAPLVGTIGFPELGIEGAAIATIFSRSLAMLVGVAIMLSGRRGIQIHLTDMAPDLTYLRKLLKIGIPASIEGTSRALSMNALLIVVGLFSTPVVAAFGIGTRILSVVVLPAMAVGRSVETMCGQNIGAGKNDRAARTSYVAAKILFALLALVGFVIFLFPTPIVDAFTDDPAVLGEGVTFLRYVSFSFGFIGILRAFSGGFRGAGKTMVAAAVSIIGLGVIRLPLAYVLSQYVMGVRGIWIAFLVSSAASAIIGWLWYRRGTWREGGVRDAPGPTPPDVEDGPPAAND